MTKVVADQKWGYVLIFLVPRQQSKTFPACIIHCVRFRGNSGLEPFRSGILTKCVQALMATHLPSSQSQAHHHDSWASGSGSNPRLRLSDPRTLQTVASLYAITSLTVVRWLHTCWSICSTLHPTTLGWDGTGIVLVVGCTGSSDRCNTFGLWDDPSTKVGTDYRAIHPLQDSVHESYRSILHVALKLWTPFFLRFIACNGRWY